MAAPVGQQCSRTVAPIVSVTLWLLYSAPQVGGDQSQGAVFLREFTLIRRESLSEDFLSDLLNNNHKTEDTKHKRPTVPSVGLTNAMETVQMEYPCGYCSGTCGVYGSVKFRQSM